MQGKKEPAKDKRARIKSQLERYQLHADRIERHLASIKRLLEKDELEAAVSCLEPLKMEVARLAAFLTFAETAKSLKNVLTFVYKNLPKL